MQDLIQSTILIESTRRNRITLEDAGIIFASTIAASQDEEYEGTYANQARRIVRYGERRWKIYMEIRIKIRASILCVAFGSGSNPR